MPLTALHVVVISWAGKRAAAERIASAVAGQAGRLTVIYSNPEEQSESGPGTWLQLPNAAFFGPKFALALSRMAPGEVLLLIHADAEFHDWPLLLRRCRDAFGRLDDLAVWAPDFTFTPWPTRLVQLLPQPEAPDLVSVVQTDGIVTAFSPDTVERLRRLDLGANNLGWGIDWAAVAFAYASGRRVLRDTALLVTHPRSRSYGSGLATEHMRAFFAQLSHAERAQIALLRAYFHNREDAARSWRSRLWHAIAKQRRKDPLSDL